MKTIILTIYGGGIKGIIPAIFLQYFESAIGKSCYEIFDIRGTLTDDTVASAFITHSVNDPSLS